MSDSEDDFASADEGDAESSPTTDPLKGQKESAPPSASNVETKSSKSPAVKDTPKSKTDKDKTKSVKDEEKTVKKTNKAKHDKKGEGTSNTASGGTSEPVKEPDSKVKGKKGKQKGKKGKQKESKSQISSSPADTQADKSCSDKEKPVELDSDKVVEVNVEKQSEVADTDNVNETKKPVTDNETKKSETDKGFETEDSNKQPDSKCGNADTTVETQTGANSGQLTLDQKKDLIKSPSSQSISRPAPDHTDQQEDVLEKLASSAKEKSSGWGWGWGSSLLDVASSSVSTFTNQVGEGLNTVLETVESTLNMPNPEELARQNADNSGLQDDNDTTESEKNDTGTKTDVNKDADDKDSESDKPLGEELETEAQSGEVGEKTDDQSGGGWFSAWGVSNITKMVESTSKNLVHGSLDVLETLGKKTFDVINEHDPGLKKARSFLHDRGDKPNLSAMLRDAKEKEEVRVEHEKESEEARKAHFGSLFDDFQGLAHLEALEMLSNQCEKKVNVLLNALPAETISKIKPQLLMIKQNFEISEEEDEDITEQEFNVLVTDLLKSLNVGTTSDKLVKTRQKIEENFKQNCDTTDKGQIKEIHRVAISSLAEFTSKSIEQFHKAGELILIQKSRDFNYVDSSNLLLSFTKILTAETGILSTKFTECLNKMEGDEEIKVNHVVTNIFLEASNSSSYIQDGFQLLLPVIQQAAIEYNQEPE